MSQPISRTRAQLMVGNNKRLQTNENIANGGQQQAAVTYVKDAISSMQSSTKGKIIAMSNGAQPANITTTALKKRVLGEKTNSTTNILASSIHNNNNNNSNTAALSDKENVTNKAAAAAGKTRVPMGPSVKKQTLAAPVQAPVVNHQGRRVLQERSQVELQQQPSLVTVKREPIIKLEPSVAPPAPRASEKIPAAVLHPVKSVAKRALVPASTVDILPPALLEDEDEAREYEEEENRKRPRREELTQWDDLDAYDIGDPLMVSEYAVQIFEYMQELEVATMPDPDYMETQKELAWKMRGVLIDWLAEVHYKFKLLPETLFLSVNLIDRFLSLRAVSLVKLQLVGVTALFIAAKYEEVMAPSVANFIYMSDGGFTDKEILQAERYMLQALGFQLSYPSPMNFLRRISKADNYDIHSRTVAKYLMEIPLLDFNFLECPPSMISGAALCLARRMMGHTHWDANLVRYSGYTEDELLPCMERMVHYLQRPLKVNSFIFRKYATKRFLKASIFCREWVMNLGRNHEVEEP